MRQPGYHRPATPASWPPWASQTRQQGPEIAEGLLPAPRVPDTGDVPMPAAVNLVNAPAAVPPTPARGLRMAAVIVHWGVPEPSVSLASWLSGQQEVDKVVVVANDRSPRPQSLPPEVTWLLPRRNLGFAGGFEAAAAEIPGFDVYLLLNNDLELSPELLERGLAILADPTVGIAAPALHNERGLWSGAGTVGRLAFRPRERGVGTGLADAEWVAGAVMFIRAQCHQQVGFDQRYFLGFEDVDFCLRARRAGWRVVVDFSVPAWHAGSATMPSNGFLYYHVRNGLWFARRHGGWPGAAFAAARVATFLVGRTIVADLLRGRGGVRSRTVLRGLADGLWRMPRENAPSGDEPRPARWLNWN